MTKEKKLEATMINAQFNVDDEAATLDTKLHFLKKDAHQLLNLLSRDLPAKGDSGENRIDKLLHTATSTMDMLVEKIASIKKSRIELKGNAEVLHVLKKIAESE